MTLALKSRIANFKVPKAMFVAAELPRNAQRYVAAMMKSLLDVAFEGKAHPATDKLPNLRYLGVGPEPSQIIKDVPATTELVRLV